MDRTEANSGTRAVPERLRIDEAALDNWLRGYVDGYSGPLSLSQFKGGQSNPTYRLNTPREYDKGPDQSSRTMYFHYVLDLDGDGKITGGRYYGDSARIDMLWTPLKPVEGGEKGNERGNPHVSVKEVLALWRASVSEETRKKWLNVDPTEEDRLLPPEEPAADETKETV